MPHMRTDKTYTLALQYKLALLWLAKHGKNRRVGHKKTSSEVNQSKNMKNIKK